MKGDVSVPHLLVVDGTIEGNVSGRAVWVGPLGSIKGKLTVSEAEIHGKISETIEVKQLLIVRATGRVSGNVNYGALQLEQGAIISGSFAVIGLCADKSNAKLEQVLGKSERPVVVRRIEPVSLLNVAGVYTRLPPADVRAAG